MKGKAGAILVLLMIVSLITITFFIDMRVKASVLEIAQSKAQLKTIEIITQIVNEKVVSNTDYQDIVIVHKDDEGNIVMIQPNTIVLNRLMAKTVGEVAHEIGALEAETIGIPIGQLSGSQILAGYGPRIEVRVIPAGQIVVNVQNKFEQAGINQTRHLIYLTIQSNLRIAVPFMNKNIKAITTIPLAETIIVGKVPNTYVNFNGSPNELYPLIKEK